MLQDIRDQSQGIIVKVIIGVVIVTFALFGVEALVQSFTSTDTVAEVDGKEISRAELMQTTQSQRRQLIQMMGNRVTPEMLEDNVLQRQSLDLLIRRTVQTNHAEALNLDISDAQVDAYLLQVEQFQTNGVFDQAKYLNYIRAIGMTPLAFKQLVREDMLISQVRNGLARSEFVLPSQIEYVSRLQNQQRSYDFIRYSLADKVEDTDVSNEALQTYYDEHKQSFVLPEQVKLNYVLISSSDLEDDVKVSDADLNSAYEAYVGNFQEEEREASHILIDTESRSDDEAQALIQELQEKLSQGASFADLAEQYSDDLGSKDSGGDLGYISRGIMVEPFDNKLFAMNEGDVASVETEFGYHLIKLNAIHETEAPPLDDVRDELMADLVVQKAQEKLLAEHENITDLAYASDSLDDLAKEYNVSVLTTDYFGRSGGTDDVTTAPAVISAAFSPFVLEDGHNSDLIELSDTQVAIVRLNDHKAAAQQTLEEASSAITSILVQQQAIDELTETAEQALASGEGAWQSVKNATRSQSAIASLAFSMPQPVEGQPTKSVKTAANGDIIALRLNAVLEHDVELSDDERSAYVQWIRKNETDALQQSGQTLQYNKAEIERNI